MFEKEFYDYNVIGIIDGGGYEPVPVYPDNPNPVYVSDGLYYGYNAFALDNYSSAFGNEANASGQYSIALGNGANATLPNEVSFDGLNSQYRRILSLFDTDSIFFRYEDINPNYTSYEDYVNGKTLTDILNEKQDSLIPGPNVNIEENVITIDISSKQDVLSAGEGIQIDNNVISCTLDLSTKQDNLTSVQMDAVNSGITAEKVELYDNYQNTKANISDVYSKTETDDLLNNLPRDCYVTGDLENIGEVMNTGSVIFIENISLRSAEVIPKSYTNNSFNELFDTVLQIDIQEQSQLILGESSSDTLVIDNSSIQLTLDK